MSCQSWVALGHVDHANWLYYMYYSETCHIFLVFWTISINTRHRHGRIISLIWTVSWLEIWSKVCNYDEFSGIDRHAQFI